MSEQLIQLHIEEPNEAVMLLGISDQNMKLIEESMNISILTRGDTISLAGEEQDIIAGKYLLEQLLKVIRKGVNINLRDISTAIEMVKNGTIEYFAELYDEEIARTAKGKAIRAKTIGQREYIHAIRKNDLVFCIGPAGTGKTYLAVVLAVQAMKTGSVKRIILTRDRKSVV